MTVSQPLATPHADRIPPVPHRPARGIELAVTCVVHVAAVAVGAMAFDWQVSGTNVRYATAHPLIVALHQPDRSTPRPKAGLARNRIKPAPLSPQPKPLLNAKPDPTPQLSEQAPNIADPSGSHAPPALDAQAWRRALMARLEAQRTYPNAALRRDWQGSGAVLFRIERCGRLLGATLATSTGHDALDKAALAMVQRAAPFPAIPESLPDEMAITLPIAFLIDHPAGRQP
ncbi:energy transducer TonB [Novosphingobium rosa]|uniref:energy transducer TonB n=1 Tax=Novosphingobium rosa TaxID=76978 RepID=UPI00083060FE|nr:TonB family protein [Novosphingobium rosa]